MIDTHCHLHDKQFEGDREQTIARAFDAGVSAMLTVGCDIDDSARALAIAQRFNLHASAGIHPHEAKDAPDDVAATLAPFLDDPHVIAVGETGLDYYYDRSPREVQQRVMRAQIECARERALPLIFHQRDAFDDFVAIVRETWTPQMRGVVHCFTGNREQAQLLVREFGLTLGIGGVVTFANAEPLREAVRSVGMERIVLETDCPYLAPVPVRGRRNEPAFVAHTAVKLAEVLGIGLDEVVATADRNAYNVFGM